MTLGTHTLDPGIFTASGIVVTALLLIFCFTFLLFLARTPYPAMVFHCNLLTRGVFLSFCKLFLIVHCLQILYQLYSQGTILPRLFKTIDLVALTNHFESALMQELH